MIAEPDSAYTTNSQKRCPHCGKSLAARVCRIGNKELFAGYIECDCDGAVSEREDARRREEEEARRKSRERHFQRQERAGIPKRFREAHANSSDYVDAVMSGKSIVFSGGIGTGKTYLACAIASALVDDCSVVFTTMGEINDAHFDGGEEAKAFISSLSRCRLLVIDDLGKEKPSDWLLSITYRAIDARYNAELPVIITTNYTMRELRERLGAGASSTTAQAIVSRLYEMCGGAPVRLDGGDRRLNVG